jgi:leader peptidase (prepilin peptidase)/N-methyltransferase
VLKTGKGKDVLSEILSEVPKAFFTPWAFLLGLLVGSFLNVVIYRLPLGRSVVAPPSACTNCNTPLPWWLNLPVVSYLALGGRCRFCGTSYSFRYAALEMVTGCFFLAAELKFGFLSPLFWKIVVLFALCLVVFFIDFDHWIIPDGVNAAGVVLGLCFSVVAPIDSPTLLDELLGFALPSVVLSLLGVIFGLVFFWSIQIVGLALAKQEAMGGGDVKFAALIGAFLGPSAALWAFLGSFFLGALFAVPMLLARKGGGKDPIPFGTFMAAAAVAVAYYGTEALLAPFEQMLIVSLVFRGLS